MDFLPLQVIFSPGGAKSKLQKKKSTIIARSYAVPVCRRPEGLDSPNEGHLRGLFQPAEAGFVN